jgi:hypothetical protein
MNSTLKVPAPEIRTLIEKIKVDLRKGSCPNFVSHYELKRRVVLCGSTGSRVSITRRCRMLNCQSSSGNSLSGGLFPQRRSSLRSSLLLEAEVVLRDGHVMVPAIKTEK